MESVPEPQQWVVVARRDDFATRAIMSVRVGGHDLIVVYDKGKVRACQRLCPHEFADLAAGRIAGDRLFCARHYASFDLDDGISGNGWQLPRLKIYPARVADGNVEVDASAVSADPPTQFRRLPGASN